MNTKAIRFLKALMPTRRRFLFGMAALIFGFSLIPPAPTAHAQNDRVTNDDSTSYGDLLRQNRQAWSRIKSPESARKFFGVPDKNSDLYFRNYVGDEWRIPTSETSDKNFEDYQRDAMNKKAAYKVQVYRAGYEQWGPNRENPRAFASRNLSLTGGYYLDDSAIKEVAEKYQSGKELAVSVLSPAAGLGMGLIGGTDEHATWVFTGDGNPNVQMILMCNPGGGLPIVSSNDKEGSSRFVYLKDVENIQELSSETTDDGVDSGTSQFDEHKIADVYKVNQLRENEGDGRKQVNVPDGWTESTMAVWLCGKAVDRDTFEEWCSDNLKEENCISEAESFFRFNPMSWAIGQIRKIVGAFLGLVADGLDQITILGNLASTDGVRDSWKVARDLVNVVFILIMIVIAFSTMLRLDTQRYSIRSLLPRLIFAVIAVNFSLLIVTIVSNVAAVLGSPFIHAVPEIIQENPVSSVDSLGSFYGGLAMEMVLLMAALVVGIVMLGLLLLFVFRVIIIWLLGVFAPFAFLFMVLPLSRSLSAMWFKNLLKWAFMAPVAYFILWVGTNFLNSSDQIDDILLSILVFIGVVVAAIMIPLKLGGEIMSRALQGSKLGGKGAGKLGMAGVGRIPIKGTDAATRLRAAGYGTGLLKSKNHPVGSRGHFKQAAALEHLEQQTADGKGIGRLTGATSGQKTLARQGAISRKQKEMALVTPAGKLRIAHAHPDVQPQMLDAAGVVSTDNDGFYLNADGEKMLDAGGEKYMQEGNIYDSDKRNLGAIQHDEMEFAHSQFASEAAFAELAQAGIAQPELAEAYAKSGLPQMNAADPAMASLDRDGKYSQNSANAKVKYASHDDMKKWDDQFLKGAVSGAHKVNAGQEHTMTPYERTAYNALQNLDTTRASYAVTKGQRQSMERESSRKYMKQFAEAGGWKAEDGKTVDVRKNAIVANSHDKQHVTEHGLDEDYLDEAA